MTAAFPEGRGSFLDSIEVKEEILFKVSVRLAIEDTVLSNRGL